MNIIKAPDFSNPKCKGSVTWTAHGEEFNCEYNTKLTCNECLYGFGDKDPEDDKS